MKTLNISLDILKEAIQDKSRLESLAYALQLKGMFRSGDLHYRKQGDLKALFRMGNIKLSRCINNGLKYGYLRLDGDLLIANNLQDRSMHVKVNISDFNNKNSNIRIQRSLRKACIVNQIRVIETINHTFIKARGKVTSPKDYKNRGSYEKQLRGYGLKANSKTKGRLSYIRIAELSNVGRKTAIALINELIAEGVISKQLQFEEQRRYFGHSIEGDSLYLDKKQGKGRERGHLVRMFNPINGEMSLFVQYSNKYEVTSLSNYSILKNYTYSYNS